MRDWEDKFFAGLLLQGFFYNKFPKPKQSDLGTETDINLNQQLCYHVLGQPQGQDAVVWACPDHPAWMLGAEVTNDGRSALPLLPHLLMMTILMFVSCLTIACMADHLCSVP